MGWFTNLILTKFGQSSKITLLIPTPTLSIIFQHKFPQTYINHKNKNQIKKPNLTKIQ